MGLETHTLVFKSGLTVWIISTQSLAAASTRRWVVARFVSAAAALASAFAQRHTAARSQTTFVTCCLALTTASVLWCRRASATWLPSRVATSAVAARVAALTLVTIACGEGEFEFRLAHHTLSTLSS